MLLAVFRTELEKIIARPRSYIGIGAIFAIVGIIQMAMLVEGESYLSFITQSLEGMFDVGGRILNGNLVAFIILQTLIVHVPLLVALVTGDLISGEAATGTIRLLASKPVTRTGILLGKYFAGLVYTLVVLLTVATLSLGAGRLLFGTGDLVVLKSEELIILQESDVLWRFVAAFSMAYLSLILVATLSFMLSCFTDNSIGPIVITMAVILLFTIIGTLEMPMFDRIRPYLFTTRMLGWRLFFENPVPYKSIFESALVLAGHIALFLGVAVFHWNRKDILN